MVCYILQLNFICSSSASGLCPFQALEHTPTGRVGTGYSLRDISVWYLLFCSPVCSGTACPHKTSSLLPSSELSSTLPAEAAANKEWCALLAMPFVAPFKHARDELLGGHIPLGAGTSKCISA